ncbi:glycoside hydrolase family 24 protein [Mesorhizobium ciceri]|uniref:glycoside hydrolase family 24 protein n=1 Tax=Mesorhizobium ciceri TaxID=39645 RepID=UPI0004B5B02C|nr:glycoside hydrolase family 104 protein [Mesorhizobium ciceri]
MALSFIFDASKETPASVAKQRAVVEALMSSSRTPRNLGEGLNALGDGIVMNVLNRRADTAEQAGQAGAKSTFGDLLNAGSFPAAPSATGSDAASSASVGEAADYGGDQLAWTDAKPYQKALLNTISGPESGGRYDVIYGGGKFDDFSRHPNQAVRIQTGPNAGRTSSAAGKYQFLGSTWDEQAKELGLPDFSPINQDKAAWNLAAETYKAKTGQDIDTVLQSGDPNAIAQVGQVLSPIWTSLPGGIEQGTNTDRFVATYQRALGAGATPAQATQVAATEQAQQPVQVASLDPSAGVTTATARPMPPQYAQNGMTQQQWEAMNRPGEDLAPSGAAPAPQPGEVGGPEAVTPAGQRVLGTMMDKTPLSGAGGVVQALSAANQPAPAAAAAPSPVVQALASAQQPQQAAPVSPAVQKVAQALAPQQQAQAQPQTDDLPVIAGGSADAIQPGQAGPSVQQIMQVAADPWASPEQKAMANMMLQQRMQEQDPLRQLQIQAARKSLAAPPKQWQKLDDNTLFDPTSGETKAINGATSGDIFDGKSVEGQSLNWLIKNGKLTPEQAAQVGAGKTITGPNGEIIFMTPQGVFGQAAGGGPAQPVTPSPVPQASPAQSVPAPAAPITAPAAPGTVAPPAASPQQQQSQARPGMIPLTDPKSLKKAPNEAQQRNQQLYTVVKPEVERIDQTFGAMSDPSNQLWSNLPVGADYATTQEYQQAANSLRTVVASYLYSVSGATATPGEVENLSATLIPRVGEKKPSIDDKLARIHTMVEAIKNNRGDIQDEAPAGSKKTSTGIDWSIEQ